MRVLSILFTMALLSGCGTNKSNVPQSSLTGQPPVQTSNVSSEDITLFVDDCSVAVNGLFPGWYLSTMKVSIQPLAKKCEEITLSIDSVGGFYPESSELIAYLEGLPLTTQGGKRVMSLAVLYYLAGDRRLVQPDSTFFLHNSVRLFEVKEVVDAREARKLAALLDHYDSLYSRYVAERTGLSPAEVMALMEGDTTLTAEQAVELGFAHAIVE
jgi:ATP-dependent protease ClpP protease subunit